ncbi:MAG: family 10 glycosylhydrolase, partial [Planctomycetota bacterium]
MSTLRRRLPCFAALVALVVPLLAGGGVAEAEELPEPRREFRAAWIATVANIDWPSRRDMPMDEAKAELVAQLDRLVEMNMNAVVFQIRPTGDALYRSELEPWSEWLTGEAGKAPSPMWDPLEFAVEEAHARGIELHVWFNPYRAKHAGSETDPVAPALAATNPSVVKQYGNQMWMDPGEPAVQRHSLAVVLDVTRRYDIDGVHMDDYFYPYPVRDDDGNEIDFPDDASFAAYVEGGGKLSRDDWRRKSVNDFVQEMYAGVKAIKPHVK